MPDQFSQFLRILQSFQMYQVEYVLVGGVAMILHGLQRLTRDIDIFMKLSSDNVARLQQALLAVFDDPAIEEITLQALQEYAVLRYGTPDGFYLDVMARLGEMASYQDIGFETIEYQGISVRLATPESLYRLKKDTVRPKDRADAMFLAEKLGYDI